jgi:hypothetical protein
MLGISIARPAVLHDAWHVDALVTIQLLELGVLEDSLDTHFLLTDTTADWLG